MKTILLVLALIATSHQAFAADDQADADAQKIAGTAIVGIGGADMLVHGKKSNAISKQYKELETQYLAEMNRLSALKDARMRELAPNAAKKLDAIRAKDPRDLWLEPSDKGYAEVEAVKKDFYKTTANPEIREYDRLIEVQIKKLNSIGVRAAWSNSMVPYRPMQLMEKSVHEFGLAVRGLGIAGAGAGLVYIGTRGDEKIEQSSAPEAQPVPVAELKSEPQPETERVFTSSLDE